MGRPGTRRACSSRYSPGAGWPAAIALGETHPLLIRARALAERLGIIPPGTVAAVGEASLDTDA